MEGYKLPTSQSRASFIFLATTNRTPITATTAPETITADLRDRIPSLFMLLAASDCSSYRIIINAINDFLCSLASQDFLGLRCVASSCIEIYRYHFSLNQESSEK